jgi:hypothetical protein
MKTVSEEMKGEDTSALIIGELSKSSQTTDLSRFAAPEPGQASVVSSRQHVR